MSFMHRAVVIAGVIVATVAATSVELMWSVNVSVGSSYSPSAMIVTADGTLVAQTVNATSMTNTVTGIAAATGRLLFQQVPDGSTDSTGRTGLAAAGDGTCPGHFFQEVQRMTPFQNSLRAYSTTTGDTLWSFTNEELVYIGLPNPFAFKGAVYAGPRSMFAIDASSGVQLANRSDGGTFVGSTAVGYTFTDVRGVATDVVVYPWTTPTIAFNVTDPSNPTQLWNISKVMPGQGTLSNNPLVTPDQKTVFVQTASANTTSEGLWLGALDSQTGVLEPGFGTVNVDFSTTAFAVSNAAVFATKQSPSGAMDVVAYDRATGRVLWLTQVSPTARGFSCVYDARFDTILCALTAAPTHKSAQATQLVVVDPTSAGRVTWQHTFPQTEGSVISWSSFAPILVARDEAIVLWQFAPDAEGPNAEGPAGHAVRRVKMVRRSEGATRRG